jgi:hypothetical protein
MFHNRGDSTAPERFDSEAWHQSTYARLEQPHDCSIHRAKGRIFKCSIYIQKHAQSKLLLIQAPLNLLNKTVKSSSVDLLLRYAYCDSINGKDFNGPALI